MQLARIQTGIPSGECRLASRGQVPGYGFGSVKTNLVTFVFSCEEGSEMSVHCIILECGRDGRIASWGLRSWRVFDTSAIGVCLSMRTPPRRVGSNQIESPNRRYLAHFARYKLSLLTPLVKTLFDNYDRGTPKYTTPSNTHSALIGL